MRAEEEASPETEDLKDRKLVVTGPYVGQEKSGKCVFEAEVLCSGFLTDSTVVPW